MAALLVGLQQAESMGMACRPRRSRALVLDMTRSGMTSSGLRFLQRGRASQLRGRSMHRIPHVAAAKWRSPIHLSYLDLDRLYIINRLYRYILCHLGGVGPVGTHQESIIRYNLHLPANFPWGSGPAFINKWWTREKPLENRKTCLFLN